MEAHAKRFVCLTVIMLCILVAMCFVSMNTGYSDLHIRDVLRILSSQGSADENLILFEFRLVRIVLAMLVGAGLSVSGLVFQSISKNDLASPDLLGVSAGAGLAVMVYVYHTSESVSQGIFALPFVSLAGAALTAILIYSLAHQKGRAISLIRLVLMGVSISAGISAVSMILRVRLSPEKYNVVNTWMIGSVYGNTWRHVLVLIPWLFLILPYLFYHARDLNLLRLSDEVAIGLGSPLKRSRFLYLMLAVALAASCVAIGGNIGFVGLICPHLAKRLIGPNHQYSLLVSALSGAILLLVADWVSRVIIAPSEMLLGIVVSMIGAPYFLYVLLTSKS